MSKRFEDSDFVPKPWTPDDDRDELDERSEMDDSEVPRLGASVASKLEEIELEDVLAVLFKLGRSATRSTIIHHLDLPANVVIRSIEELLAEGKIEETNVRLRDFKLNTETYCPGVRISFQLYAELKGNEQEIEAELMNDWGEEEFDD